MKERRCESEILTVALLPQDDSATGTFWADAKISRDDGCEILTVAMLPQDDMLND